MIADAHEHNIPKSRAVLVVGVDFTDVSEHLVRTARALARTVEEAELHFVHVIAPHMVILASDAMNGAMLVENETVNAARGTLERICSLIEDDVSVEIFVHTPVGRTCESLSEIARRLEADLVVVEAHDHSRRSVLRSVFHRSTAAELARTAPCSVLTVRARDSARGESEMRGLA
jgi:nucleotide-binding universal stress UspA family protein